MRQSGPTACILYGFCEGPQVAKRFITALHAAGYRVIRDAQKADIIFTHSGGCYLLPEHFRAKRIIHIGMWYWPGKSWIASAWDKFVGDLRSHHQEGELRFWLRKSLWHFIYIWKLRANTGMYLGKRRGAPWQYGAITLVARPKFDSFCAPDIAQLPFAARPKFETTPGHHDDCWRNPMPYIALLQSRHGKRLLATSRSK